MKLASFRLPVRPSVPSFGRRTPRCGGFAVVVVGSAARGYPSIAARPALSGKCEQCHVN